MRVMEEEVESGEDIKMKGYMEFNLDKRIYEKGKMIINEYSE